MNTDKGEERASMLCRFGWHKWTVWCEPTMMKVIGVWSNPADAYVQKRKCRKCGKVEVKTL